MSNLEMLESLAAHFYRYAEDHAGDGVRQTERELNMQTCHTLYAIGQILENLCREQRREGVRP